MSDIDNYVVLRKANDCLRVANDKLIDALKKILVIEDNYSGTDWQEIEEARLIAKDAIYEHGEPKVSRLRAENEKLVEALKKIISATDDKHFGTMRILRIAGDAICENNRHDPR